MTSLPHSVAHRQRVSDPPTEIRLQQDPWQAPLPAFTPGETRACPFWTNALPFGVAAVARQRRRHRTYHHRRPRPVSRRRSKEGLALARPASSHWWFSAVLACWRVLAIERTLQRSPPRSRQACRRSPLQNPIAASTVSAGGVFARPGSSEVSSAFRKTDGSGQIDALAAAASFLPRRLISTMKGRTWAFIFLLSYSDVEFAAFGQPLITSLIALAGAKVSFFDAAILIV